MKPFIALELMFAFAAFPAFATFDGESGRIALTVNIPVAAGENTTSAIYDDDGTQLTFPDPATGADSDPAYFPDGELIAYIHPDFTLNDTLIQIMNADGSDAYTFLSSDSLDEGAVLSSPHWSADGQKIAFSVSTPSAPGDGGIFTIDAGGSSSSIPAGTSTTRHSPERPRRSDMPIARKCSLSWAARSTEHWRTATGSSS